uniref:UDENN domain-containing protein n=1 Tax=Heterorhabditis bacteriophora TaxID=37862 RepID=A0A1I7XJP6_HETBA
MIYPGDAVLSSQEKTNICYLAFPDSNSGNTRDTNFHFRIRRLDVITMEYSVMVTIKKFVNLWLLLSLSSKKILWFDSSNTIQIKNGPHFETLILSTVHHVDVYKALNNVLNHVQLLWELVLIGEPVLIVANTPQRCSSIVQALVSLIAPLKYFDDYRPFFTIHDSEFKEYSSKCRSPYKLYYEGFLELSNSAFF